MPGNDRNPETEARPDGDESPSGGVPVQTNAAPALSDEHRRMLVSGSDIDPEVVSERGYYTVQTKKDLKLKGFGEAQRDTLAPQEGKYGLLAPIRWPSDPEPPFWVLRPDAPRVKKGKHVKYEMPAGCQMALDSPPRCHADLGNPAVPAFFTEGQKKGDSGASRGGCWVTLIGTNNWRGTNSQGGKTVLAALEDVALNDRRKVYLVFDSDILQKRAVYDALVRLREVAKKRGADVWIVHLPSGPNGEKVGADDWFAADPARTLHDLMQLATKELVRPAPAWHAAPERKALAEALSEDAPVPDRLVVPLGYEVGAGGVVRVEVRGEGEDMRELKTEVAPRPIYVAGMVERLEGDEHRLVIVGRYRNRWVRVDVGRDECMDARKLVHLAGRGLPITSGRSGLLSEYLDAFEAQNIDRLPCARVSAQAGWIPGGDYLLGKRTIRKKED